MAKLEEVEPLLKACLENVERFVASAMAVANVPDTRDDCRGESTRGKREKPED
jgi:hypothetical protein